MSELFAPSSISVSELNALAKPCWKTISRVYGLPASVQSDPIAASGHCISRSKTAARRCVARCLRGAAMRLAKPLKEGDHIEVSGKISIYEARANFRLP